MMDRLWDGILLRDKCVRGVLVFVWLGDTNRRSGRRGCELLHCIYGLVSCTLGICNKGDIFPLGVVLQLVSHVKLTDYQLSTVDPYRSLPIQRSILQPASSSLWAASIVG